MMWNVEKVRTHPYNSRCAIPDDARLLIVGTCPPPRFERPSESKDQPDDRDFDFYYGSRDNQLWLEILPKVFEKGFPKDERDRWCDFLRQQRFWMHDILETYTRKSDDAKDTNICPVSFCNLKGILASHPDIEMLICTGAHAERWTRECMMCQRMILSSDWKIKGRMPRRCDVSFLLGGRRRKLRICALPSPTPASDRRYKIGSKIKMYSEELRHLSGR